MSDKQTVKTIRAALLGLLFLWGGALAQPAQVQVGAEPSPETIPAAPDVVELPPDWLASLEAADLDADTVRRRLDEVVVQAERRIDGLDEASRATAREALDALRRNVAALLAVIRKPTEAAPETIPSQDQYTLEEFLSLRAQWRRVNQDIVSRKSALEQSEQQADAQRAANDRLVQEYGQADPNTPARVILGLRRMASGIELVTLNRTNGRLAEIVQQRENMLAELDDRLSYARRHLVPGDLSTTQLESATDAADAALSSVSANRRNLQNRLAEALSTEAQTDAFDLLKLKQQLTLALARESLQGLEKALVGQQRHWYLLRNEVVDSRAGIEAATQATAEQVQSAESLVPVWTRASQVTLVTARPPPGEWRQEAAFREAQNAARESLEAIRHIGDRIDDLAQLEILLADEMVQRGLAGPRTRLMQLAAGAWQGLKNVTSYRLFYIGDTPIGLGSLFKFLVVIVFGFLLSRLIRFMLRRLQRRKERLAASASIYTLGRILHYLIITIAVLVGFTVLGLDIGSLALIAGALSVGIGFGLQSIVNNFLSGLILLTEGSLRVGDFIELDSGVTGVVREISTRYTRINTNDNVDVVVPNSELVSYKLTNWTLREPVVRVRIPFGVAYGSDKERVREAALAAADDVPFTLKGRPDRQPAVLLVNFGESSLDFELRVWVLRTGVNRPGRVKAAYNWALESRLREYGIEIPFPQRDLHWRDGMVSLAHTDGQTD